MLVAGRALQAVRRGRRRLRARRGRRRRRAQAARARARRRRPDLRRHPLGTAINQDGRTPAITVPSAEAQEALLRDGARCGRARAGRRPGTSRRTAPARRSATRSRRGASARARRPRAAGGRCVIGSVEDATSATSRPRPGIAGLIKAALALQHRAGPAEPQLRAARTRRSTSTALRLRVPTRARAVARTATARRRSRA